MYSSYVIGRVTIQVKAQTSLHNIVNSSRNFRLPKDVLWTYPYDSSCYANKGRALPTSLYGSVIKVKKRSTDKYFCIWS